MAMSGLPAGVEEGRMFTVLGIESSCDDTGGEFVCFFFVMGTFACNLEVGSSHDALMKSVSSINNHTSYICILSFSNCKSHLQPPYCDPTEQS